MCGIVTGDNFQAIRLALGRLEALRRTNRGNRFAGNSLRSGNQTGLARL